MIISLIISIVYVLSVLGVIWQGRKLNNKYESTSFLLCATFMPLWNTLMFITLFSNYIFPKFEQNLEKVMRKIYPE